MQERLKKIPERFLEFWNKYTTRQKTIIISVVCAIFFTIVLLAYFLTRPKYDAVLGSFEDSKEATEVITLLEGNGISYEQSRDGKIIYVEEKNYTKGLNLLASNDILTDEMGWENFAFNNSMSTTEKEKEQKITLATQTQLRNNILKMEGIRDATVIIDKPASQYMIFEEEKEPSVSIILDLSEEITDEQAQYMAMWVANAMGSETADNVVIMDSQRNLLFGGKQEELLGGAIADKEEYKRKLTNQLNHDVEAMMVKAEFDDVNVTSNMKYDFDKITEQYTEYTPAEGQEQGVYSHSYQYSSKGSSGSGGIPGTESNDEDTDYMIETGGSTDTQITLDKYDYLPNERIQNIEYEIGAVVPEESSMSVVLTKYVVYNEEDLKRQGLLEDTTFENFILANNTRTSLAVDEQYYQLIASATGIAAENITIMAYSQPVFNEEIKEPFDVTNYLMIILAVLIVALLIFVVFRGTAPVEVTEMEPELSVEQLLATTKENQSLEDIEFSEKSETRRMIEKFVDENPEAVATLLRNWLQDDWG